MNKTTYKNRHRDMHYDRIELAVPKGMKQVIKSLASDKDMTINAYLQYLVHQDQEGMFDSLQIAEKNRKKIRSIQGNLHDGYDLIFCDGHQIHSKTKLEVRKAIISYLT